MVSTYVIYFILMSVLGYFYECLAMILWTGKWDNRGFLYGPVIPIYGGCALFGTLFLTYVYTDHTPLSVFLIAVFFSAIVEYLVHYLLEKFFNAYWWDYSKSPLNINGRICLPASIGFGIAGIIIVYVINPYLLPLIEVIPQIPRDIISIILVMLFTADFTLTICVLSTFIARVENLENNINEHMDVLVGNVTDESKGLNTYFYNAVDKIESGGKKLIYKPFGIFSDAARAILSKIKGFRGNSDSRINRILRAIKNRIKHER